MWNAVAEDLWKPATGVEMRISVIRRTLLLFSFLIVVLLLNAYFSYRAISQLVESEKLLAHTYTVLSAIDALEFRLQDSQTSADDFVITGRPENLAAYRDYISQANAKIDLLRELTGDNPDQQTLIAGGKRRTAELEQFLTAAVEARSQNRMVQPPTGEKLQAILQVVGTMKNREAELLRRRSEIVAASLRTAKLGLLIGSVATIMLMLLLGYLIITGERQRNVAQESRLRLAAIVDSSDDAIISKMLDGTLLSWNHGAEDLYGYNAEEMVGKSIFLIIPPERHEEMNQIFQTLRQGHRVDHLETVRLRRDGTRVDVDVTVSPLRDETGRVTGASAIARDITERKRMEDSLRQLSGRILKAQDEERRRIAREIHDSTVQKLALLSMNLAQLQNTKDPQAFRAMLQSSQDLSKQCAQELRSVSYLLHPPMLEELGLVSALKIYAEGFSQRSGVALDIEVEPDFERLPPEMEITLFRVAQESLSNILRHSNSQRAKIKLSRNSGIELAVMDEGRGFSQAKKSDVTGDVQMGVGILGMTERMKQLGGTLRIDSGPTGTSVNAHLPYARGMDAQDPNRHRG
jgi:two-component system NarL family sensor kinase